MLALFVGRRAEQRPEGDPAVTLRDALDEHAPVMVEYVERTAQRVLELQPGSRWRSLATLRDLGMVLASPVCYPALRRWIAMADLES